MSLPACCGVVQKANSQTVISFVTHLLFFHPLTVMNVAYPEYYYRLSDNTQVKYRETGSRCSIVRRFSINSFLMYSTFKWDTLVSSFFSNEVLGSLKLSWYHRDSWHIIFTTRTSINWQLAKIFFVHSYTNPSGRCFLRYR